MGDLRQRNYVIDFAKAIAIILVVIGHWYPADSPAWWIGIRDVIYSFHMPLFMAASGYIYIYIYIYAERGTLRRAHPICHIYHFG